MLEYYIIIQTWNVLVVSSCKLYLETESLLIQIIINTITVMQLGGPGGGGGGAQVCTHVRTEMTPEWPNPNEC